MSCPHRSLGQILNDFRWWGFYTESAGLLEFLLTLQQEENLVSFSYTKRVYRICSWNKSLTHKLCPFVFEPLEIPKRKPLLFASHLSRKFTTKLKIICKVSIKTATKYCKLSKVTYNFKIKYSRLVFKVQKYWKSQCQTKPSVRTFWNKWWYLKLLAILTIQKMYKTFMEIKVTLKEGKIT